MSQTVRVIHLRPGEPPKLVNVDPNSNQELSRLLDGGYMEMLRLGDTFAVFFDEEGKLKGLTPNVLLFPNYLVGPVFFARLNPPDIATLTDQDVTDLLALLLEEFHVTLDVPTPV